MQYRAELRVIAIARDAVMLLPLVLSLFHLVNDFHIFVNNKLPIAETFAEHFSSFPSEESLCGGRPAQDAKFVIPLDDRERRVLDVERETPVVVGRRCFREFAFSHVANDGDAADHFASLVMTRRVVAVKETITTRLRDDVETILGDDAFACERLEVVFVFSGFLQTGEKIESVFAEHHLTLHAGDALHRAVPGGVTTLAIEGDDAVDVGFEQALEKEVLFLHFVRHCYKESDFLFRQEEKADIIPNQSLSV